MSTSLTLVKLVVSDTIFKVFRGLIYEAIRLKKHYRYTTYEGKRSSI